jgi:hypothetical protein
VRITVNKPHCNVRKPQGAENRLSRLAQVALFALLLVFVAHSPAQTQYYLKADQTADLHEPKLVEAKQDCANWGLAAGLETMLAQQKVMLDQNFWVMRLNYGEICVDKVPSIEFLTKVVSQEFTLDDGRRVRLELRVIAGAPTTANIDEVLVQLKKQQPTLLLWRGHPYYLTGVTYDEQIGSNGSRIFQVKEFRLADTFAKQPAVTFQRSSDNPGDIDGILSVRVTPL